MSSKGMGGHQATIGKSQIWLTPNYITDPLGAFDLDPCCHQAHPSPIGKTRFYPPMDGYSLPWFGRVWLNPPYSSTDCGRWLEKLATHGNGISLIFARTETDWFFKQIWQKADSVLFLRGRIHFLHPNGTRAKFNAGAPSCLVAYGANNSEILKTCGLTGHFVEIDKLPTAHSAQQTLF